jgi:2-isopropylmalate synthase
LETTAQTRITGNRNSKPVGIIYDIPSILEEISKLGLYTKNPKQLAKVTLARMKELESLGYNFGAALASVHLLILQMMGSNIVPFTITGWQTSTVRSLVETRKVRANLQGTVGQGSATRTFSVNSEGVGPIHAIDLSLRKALSKEFPETKEIKLVSYSLNIVDSSNGSAAAAIARTEFDDDSTSNWNYPSTWATIAVSDDVIDASVRALIDGYRYKLIFLNKKERFAIPDWRVAIA